MAALVVVFAFGGLLNAFGMTGPAYTLQDALAGATGLRLESLLLALVFVAALVVLPLILLGSAAAATRRLAPTGRSWGRVATEYAYALVPLGFGIWIAHYGFHLLTGLLTILPVTQSAAADLFGRPVLGEPLWTWAGMRPGAVYPLEMGFLLLGALGSIATAHGLSQRDSPDRAGRATAPWALVIVVVAGAAVWILSQPMEMRGTAL
jgi:hypothetical protein